MKDKPYAVLHETFPATEILKQAQQMFGRQYQMGIVVEECSELQKELLKNTNRKKDNIKEIIDETADVYIGLLHVVISYDINDAVGTRVREKLERLQERLKIKQQSSSLEEYAKAIENQKKTNNNVNQVSK